MVSWLPAVVVYGDMPAEVRGSADSNYEWLPLPLWTETEVCGWLDRAGVRYEIHECDDECRNDCDVWSASLHLDGMPLEWLVAFAGSNA